MISGNTGDGIFLVFVDSLVASNRIGTDSAGTTGVSNLIGVDVEQMSTSLQDTIGGTTSSAENLISGNNEYGVYLQGTSDVVVEGNFIGTDASGTQALANPIGVFIQRNSSIFALDNTVGGTAAGAANLISATCPAASTLPPIRILAT